MLQISWAVQMKKSMRKCREANKQSLWMAPAWASSTSLGGFINQKIIQGLWWEVQLEKICDWALCFVETVLFSSLAGSPLTLRFEYKLKSHTRKDSKSCRECKSRACLKRAPEWWRSLWLFSLSIRSWWNVLTRILGFLAMRINWNYSIRSQRRFTYRTARTSF